MVDSRFCLLEERISTISHPGNVSSIALLIDLPWVDISWADMNLTNNASVVASLIEQLWTRLNVIKRGEVKFGIVQTILAVLVNMQAGIDYRATRAARRCTRESHVEQSPFFGHSIDVRGANCFFSIASQIPAEVVRDHQQDIPGHLW